MARINLLPWREEYRQEKKKEFISQLIAVCLFSGLIAFGWITIVESAIKKQNARNSLLSQEIKSLESQVKEINELKSERDKLIARMKVIQDLQGTRPTIVHYFDEMVKAVPNGVFVNSIKRTGNIVAIDGVAESNNRVSSFMRNLDRSDWFSEPNLKSVVSDEKNGPDAVAFSMFLNMILPSQETQNEEVAGNG